MTVLNIKMIVPMSTGGAAAPLKRFLLSTMLRKLKAAWRVYFPGMAIMD
jgi:hypothetical protein